MKRVKEGTSYNTLFSFKTSRTKVVIMLYLYEPRNVVKVKRAGDDLDGVVDIP